MSLFEDASLIVTPNGVKEGKLYSIKPTDGSGDLSVTRATTATRVNSAGLVEVVPYNFAQYSNTFNNGIWVTGGYGNLPTLTANLIQNPVNGLTDAWLASFSASGTQGRLLQLFSGLSVGVPYTYSMYVKAGTKTSVTIYSDTASVGYNAVYNLSNGTITSISGVTATITEVSNGWYFLTLTNNILPTGLGQYGIVSSTGEDGTLYIYGAQLNIGSTAKPYYPTTTRLNIPRLDYTNGTCPSILVEPQRTNLLTYSDDFSNAIYTKIETTINTNTTISPSGIQNADSILEVASNESHQNWQRVSMTSGQSYTQSCYFKANGRNRVIMQIFDNATQYANAIFDLSSGVVVGSFGTATIQNMTNGWYRCTITGTSPATGLGYCVIGLCENTYSTPSIMPTYLGDITKGVYAWGAQLEVGAYATSYVPTQNSSVTRNADVISKTGISSLIGQTEGTMFFDLVFPQSQTASYIGISSGTGRIILGCESGFFFTFGYTSGTSLPLNVNTRYKIAMAYNSTNMKIYANGVLLNTLTGTMPTGTLSRFAFDSGGGSQNLIASVNTCALFKTKLSDSELAQLTTI
jgi:hypothetical protein